MLYTAKTLPSHIHFTPLHSLHANAHDKPCFLQVYFRLSQLSLRQHLTTTNKFSGANVKSVVRISRWSSTLRYLPVFWIQLVAFSHQLLHLKIAPRAVGVRSSSGREEIVLVHLSNLSPLSRKNACIVVHLSLYH